MTITTNIASPNTIAVDVKKPKTVLGAVTGHIIVWPPLGWRIRDIEQEKGQGVSFGCAE